MPDSAEWERVVEPLGRTLRRTVGIALVIGAGVALGTHEVRLLLPVALLALWPSLGGHYVEVAFLKALRPILAPRRAVQVASRILIWLFAGVILYLLMALTSRILPLRPLPWRFCWAGGLAFVVIELVAHLGLALRGLPNSYDGRG